MAIRIGQSPATSFPAVLPQEQSSMPMGMEDDMMTDMSQAPDMAMGGGQVDPEVARYLEPNYRCNNCVHFMEPGSCEIVAGPIDPEAVCSLYSPDTELMEAPDESQDELLAAGPAVEETEEDVEDAS